LGELEPEHACGGFHGAVLRALAIPLGRWLPLVAAAAEDLGLFLLERFLEHAFRGQPDQRTQQLLATLRVALSLQPLGQLLCFRRTRRSLPCHAGGAFFLVMQRSHITLTVPEKGLSS
jgi:branched-subunit amino acid ABC-type transport system permease component